MQKFREWQKIQSLEKHSIMLDFKLFNLFWNIENLAPPPSKKCSSLEKNVDPSQKSAWNMSFSTHIFFHFQPIKDSFEVSLDIEISIVFEIKSKFFKIDRSQCFSKIHIPVHCRSNFENLYFLGEGPNILKNLDFNFQLDRNFDLDGNFERNFNWLKMKKYVSWNFLGKDRHFFRGNYIF